MSTQYATPYSQNLAPQPYAPQQGYPQQQQQGFAPPMQQYGFQPQQGFAPSQQGYEPQQQNFAPPPQGYPVQQQGFAPPQHHFQPKPSSSHVSVMSSASSLQYLASIHEVVCKERVNPLELLTDLELGNTFDLAYNNGSKGIAAEESSGLAKYFLRGQRPFSQHIYQNNQHVFEAKRKWVWFGGAKMEIIADGRVVARLWHDWPRGFLWQRHIHIYNEDKTEKLLTIKGWDFHTWICGTKPWTYKVIDCKTGQKIGHIRKKWSGFFRELFTDADTFECKVDPNLSPDLKAAVIGATFLINVKWYSKVKQNNNNNNS